MADKAVPGLSFRFNERTCPAFNRQGVFLMALRGVIVVAAVSLVAISLMGSKDADAALNVPRANGSAQSALVLQIHGKISRRQAFAA